MKCVWESFYNCKATGLHLVICKQNQYYALCLDISCLISSPMETICRKSQIFISGKNMKNVSLCSVFLLPVAELGPVFAHLFQQSLDAGEIPQ